MYAELVGRAQMTDTDENQVAPGSVFLKREHCTPRSGVGGIITCGSAQGHRGRPRFRCPKDGAVWPPRPTGEAPRRRSGALRAAPGARSRGGEPRGAGGEHSGRHQAGFPSPVPPLVCTTPWRVGFEQRLRHCPLQPQYLRRREWPRPPSQRGNDENRFGWSWSRLVYFASVFC